MSSRDREVTQFFCGTGLSFKAVGITDCVSFGWSNLQEMYCLTSFHSYILGLSKDQPGIKIWESLDGVNLRNPSNTFFPGGFHWDFNIRLCTRVARRDSSMQLLSLFRCTFFFKSRNIFDYSARTYLGSHCHQSFTTLKPCFYFVVNTLTIWNKLATWWSVLLS